MRCPACDGETQGPNACTQCGYLLFVDLDVATFEPGTHFDRFRIGRLVAQDDASATYEAEQLDLERAVTLHLQQPWCSEQPEFVALFQRATGVCQHVRHVHAVALEAVGDTDRILFVAMEWIERRRLSALLGKRIDWRSALDLVRRLGGVYACVHELGLTVGVNPDAIFVESPVDAAGAPYRDAVLSSAELTKVDLLAHLIRQPRRPVTVDLPGTYRYGVDRMIGIPAEPAMAYMSPERMMGKTLDKRSDIYALGVLAYELITAQMPFPDAKGPAGLITAQLRQRPQPVSQLVSDVPPEVSALIARCLEKDKQVRFPDVGALLVGIEAMQ